MEAKNERKINLIPVIGPLLRLLQSRKFMVAVVTLFIDVLIAYVPELESVQGELITVFTVIGSLVVAAIAYEDAAGKTNGNS